ncbi:MAG: hypothetical protein A4E19_15545 [Nitrospira sp. SG-bin1]|nr:MAG: hypothetical protein A4E19_15545 [Nitrospira sp. SG-bin1]
MLTGAFDAEAMRRTNQDAEPQAERYDFQHPAVLQNVPPPTVRSHRPLRWWSIDRRRRLAAVMRLRDRLVEDIMHARCRKAA